MVVSGAARANLSSNNLSIPAGRPARTRVTPPGCGTRQSAQRTGGGAGARLRMRLGANRVTQETTGPRPYIQRPGPLHHNVSITPIKEIDLAPLGPYAEVGPACSAPLRRPPRLWRRASLHSAETLPQQRATKTMFCSKDQPPCSLKPNQPCCIQHVWPSVRRADCQCNSSRVLQHPWQSLSLCTGPSEPS